MSFNRIVFSANSLFQTVMYCTTYIIISVISIFLSLLYNVAGQWAGARARHKLHKEAVSELLRAPISFFDSTPIGKILNSFSVDMAVIDKVLNIDYSISDNVHLIYLSNLMF